MKRYSQHLCKLLRSTILYSLHRSKIDWFSLHSQVQTVRRVVIINGVLEICKFPKSFFLRGLKHILIIRILCCECFFWHITIGEQKQQPLNIVLYRWPAAAAAVGKIVWFLDPIVVHEINESLSITLAATMGIKAKSLYGRKKFEIFICQWLGKNAKIGVHSHCAEYFSNNKNILFFLVYANATYCTL